MEATRPVSADLSHHLGVLRRHWWILLLATAVGLAAGILVTRALPKVYESATKVLVTAVGQDSNVVGGRTKDLINLDTEAQLVGSGAVAARAAELMRSTTPPTELARAVSVEVPANTGVLMINFEAETPQAAQTGSHAFAEAYLRNREETYRATLNSQISVLNTKVKKFTTELADINARLAKAEANSFARSNLESLRRTAQQQLDTQIGKLNELTTTVATVSAGSIISDARLPDEPISPDPHLNMGAGAMLGLLLGLLLAFARERLDRRLRTVADVRDRGRINVLAALDERTTPRFDDVLQPYGPGGRVFNRLRNEVLASLGRGEKIIVVTGASRGSATTLVAANLATALARTGSDVVLIGAHLPDSVVDAAPLARMLGIAPMPGLSDLLAGRVGLSQAMQRTPRIPSLRVITTGGAATAAGLLQSQRLQDALETLRRQTGYIVIEAPSTSSSADAQSLASLADAAILAVELRRARRPALLDAAEQLRRVGTPLLGAVVLPRLSSLRSDDAPLPAVTLAPPKLSDGGGPEGRDAATDADRTQALHVVTRPRPAPGRSGRPGGDGSSDDVTAVIDLTHRSVPDRIPADRATSERATAERATADRASADRAADTVVRGRIVDGRASDER